MLPPQYVALQEEDRIHRRTIADALDVVRQKIGLDEIAPARVEIVELFKTGIATVNVVFPKLGCRVSLPTSARFKARTGKGSEREEFEIFRLNGAELCSDRSVKLADGTRLRAVEVVPTSLLREPSQLDARIFRLFLSYVKAKDHCFRSFGEGLPESLKHYAPVGGGLDFGRLRLRVMQEQPRQKAIQAFIEDNDPELRLSPQKIADALTNFGVWYPKPRSRRRSSPELATIRLGSELSTSRNF